jgi:mannose-6-phosphate isomerase-like protein (cupin superfamily)
MSGRVEVTTVPKPWGHETIWARTDRYVGKILHIKAGHALSVQYHNRKDETIYLLSGELKYWVATGSGQRAEGSGPSGLRTAGTGETPVAG